MRVIAHRGASGHALENSLEAFDKAIEIGADWIEFDVQPCASGELIVMHDATLDRTAQAEGALDDLSWDELKTIKLNNNEPMSRLEDAIEHVGTQAGLCIELKSPKGIDAMVKLMERYSPEQHAGWIIISFWHAALKMIKDRVPGVQVGAIIAANPVDGAACAERIDAVALHPAHNILDQALVEDAQHRGIAVHPWTANEPEDIERLIMLGVQGITSDYPDRVIQALKA